MGSFVVYGARGIVFMGPCGGEGEVGAPPSLVAEAPEDDRRMIAVADDKALHTVYPGGSPRGITGQTTTQPMFFKVGLVHHIESERVAEFIPPLAVGIMTGAHGIDIGLFHQTDVTEHQFFGHHLTRSRVHLMAVHTTKACGNAVDEQLPVLDFHLTEAHFGGDTLNGLVEGVLEQEFECIEMGRFGCPLQRVLDCCAEPSPLGIAALGCTVVEDCALGVEVENRPTLRPPYKGGNRPTPALPA